MKNKYIKSLGINVHPVVFFSSILIVLSIVVSTLLNLSQAAQIFETIQSFIINKVSWFYILTVNIILGLDSFNSLADVNGDNIINVLDVIQMVNIVLGNIIASEWQSCASDSNGDGNIDILDVIQAVQFILNS